jgi:hypothetical protein
MTKRTCGTCSLCCKVMTVPDVTPAKTAHKWCSHIRPDHHGCSIYGTRPASCREFSCMWLGDNGVKDHWYPAKAKIVIHATVEKGAKYVSFVVDPAYPRRWQEEPWFSDIKEMARAGVEGRQGQKWATFVLVGDERIPIIGSTRLLRAAG